MYCSICLSLPDCTIASSWRGEEHALRHNQPRVTSNFAGPIKKINSGFYQTTVKPTLWNIIHRDIFFLIRKYSNGASRPFDGNRIRPDASIFVSVPCICWQDGSFPRCGHLSPRRSQWRFCAWWFDVMHDSFHIIKHRHLIIYFFISHHNDSWHVRFVTKSRWVNDYTKDDEYGR